MTKSEFMTALASELNQRKIADSDEILNKYRQHFAFKLADGYTEEEIAAKLGVPLRLAAQFEPSDAPKSGERRSSVLTWLWLGRPVFRRVCSTAGGLRTCTVRMRSQLRSDRHNSFFRFIFLQCCPNCMNRPCFHLPKAGVL